MTIQDTAAPARPELSAAKRALLEARLGGMNRGSPVPRRAPGCEVPLTPAQERLWFVHRLGDGVTTYNIYAGMRLRGDLDPVALERALGQVVRRHEALRTTFREVDGVPIQVVAPFSGFALPGEDLSALEPGAREAALGRRMGEVAGTVFDLEAGPLFVARLVRVGMDDHALLLCLHHIVSDGWSQRLILNETWALYDAFAEGRPSPLAEPALQYGDWAVWQRGGVQLEAQGKHLAYWKDRLSGAPELLALPADRPRPPVPSFRGGRVPVDAPVEVLERLRELARAEGATLFIAGLAAWTLVLGRYGATDDVIVAAPVAGRARRELEGVVGPFVNTVVLRTRLSGNPTFRELVGRVRETVLGGYEHQDVPFEQVVAEVRPERSRSHAPLFQVLFQLDSAGEAEVQARRSLRITELPRAADTAKADLSLALEARAGGLTGMLQFSADLFDRATAERMVRHFVRVLEQVSAAPDRPLAALALPDAAERSLVVEEWNRTAAPYPADRCIHQVFEARAARTPDAVAAVHEGESLTFAELDARADRLGRELAELGVGPEVRVGVSLERGLDLVVALLAVLKAGGAYVPLDPAYPEERLRDMLGDSRPAVLLAAAPLAGRFAAAGVPVLDPADAAVRAHRPGTDPRPAAPSPDHPCYVIYTSGSTGRPKGVEVPHRGVVSLLADLQRRAPLREGDACSLWTSTSFDVSAYEIFCSLLAGGRLCIPREEVRLDAAAFLDWMEAHDVRGAYLPPYFLPAFRDRAAASPGRACLRRLLVGVEPIPEPLLAEIRRSVPGLRIVNGYGPTETTICATLYDVPETARAERVAPIGPPAANTRVFVLDVRMHPVPVGVVGELYVGGAGVARGYLHRPAQTAERFVPDPLGGVPGARLYRTGDLGRWLPDGVLEFAGRGDAQVKVRGHRIELGEIEARLAEHPAVREAAVVVREDVPGDRRLVAYTAGEAAAPEALRAHLSARVPEYMVPAAYVWMEAMPLTPSGKVDRGALPAPGGDAYARRGEEAPEGETEHMLAGIWSEVLGIERVGRWDDFFELGGHSLLALRLLARVKRRMGCELPVSVLFAGATVRQMSAAIQERAGAGASAASLVPMQPGGSLPPLFCVHPANREVVGYLGLVRHLDSRQPVYGLRDAGDDLGRPLARIAAEHLAAIREVQPRGPYHLVGWSFGGHVAYEMAMQLQRAGQAVAFLGMLDTMSTELVQAWPWVDDVDFVVGAANDVAAINGRPFTLPRESLQGLDTDEQVRRALGALHAQEAASAEFGEAHLRDLFHTLRDRLRSRTGYVTEPFHGTLTLFRASDLKDRMLRFLAPLTGEEKRTLGWCRHVRDVEVLPVPGGHMTLASEPHVRALAAQLTHAMATARGRRPAGTEAAS